MHDRRHTDVVALVQQGRAQLGLSERSRTNPPDVGFASISERSELDCMWQTSFAGNGPHVTTKCCASPRTASQHLFKRHSSSAAAALLVVIQLLAVAGND